MKNILIAILSLSVLFSCKKEEIKDPVEDSVPVFKANIQLDGEDFLLEAGKDDVFMSTYTETVNGVERFSGKLGRSDVYIELGVFQGDLDINDPFSLKNFQGVLQFASIPVGPLAVLSKDDFPNAQVIDHIVWFKNGIQAGIDDMNISEPGRYDVCAEVHFIDGQIHQLCNELLLGYNINADCRIKHILSVFGDLHVWMDQPTSEINEIKWYLDGELYQTGEELDCVIDPNEHLIEAEISFENGSVRRKAILVDGSLSGHLINDFTYVETSPVNQIRWDYGVVINVLRDGKQYTSLTANNMDSSVEITDIEYYGQNAQGKNVYKCTGTIDAMVREVGTNSVVPITISTTFGLEMN